MESEHEKSLREAARNLQIADHMTYLTYPLVNEKRILLKIFEEIFKTVNNSVKAILNFESFLNGTEIYKDDYKNLENFVSRFSKDFLNDKQLNLLLDIYEVHKSHEDSAIEFEKKDKMIIMSDDLGLRILDIVKIKEYLYFSKELLGKIKARLKDI